MEWIVVLIIIVVFVLALRATSYNGGSVGDFVKADIEAATRATAKSLGKAAGFAQGAAQEAKEAYTASRVPDINARDESMEDRTARYAALESLKSLLEAGAITQDEFEAEKKHLLQS